MVKSLEGKQESKHKEVRVFIAARLTLFCTPFCRRFLHRPLRAAPVCTALACS